MFMLSTLADTVAIVPIDFEKRTRQAIEDNINEKYANKVIQQVGLCICFYDLLKASDGHIGGTAGDGTVFVNVEFRMIVFRPFLTEILEGRIASSTAAGIRISLDFFDDIIVPPTNLPDHTVYSASEKAWVWTPETVEGGEKQELFFDLGERVRCKVEGEVWVDQAPAMGRRAEMLAAQKAAERMVGHDRGREGREWRALEREGKALEREEAKKGKCPWRVVATMAHPGLGCTQWW